MPSKLLVRLHLPPPVTATLISGLMPASYTVTFTFGLLRFIYIAAKHSAAPEPIITTFIEGYFSSSL